MSNIPFGYMAPQDSGVWSNGSDGDLILTSGTYDLTSGQVYNFNRIIVNSGATLRLTAGANITLLGAKSIEINGILDCRQGHHAGTTYLNTNPKDGRVYSHTSSQGNGGRIFYDSNNNGRSYQGTGSYGNGVGSLYMNNAEAWINMNNATAANPSSTRGGGNGGYIYGNNYTGGGGGGARGAHGLGVVLNASKVIGTGSIYAQGSSGGHGHPGGISSTSYGSYSIQITGWAPGAGGAGGSGGRVWIEYYKEYSPTLYGNISYAGASGGAYRHINPSGLSAQDYKAEAGATGSTGGKHLISLGDL
jgi:hypothetical protein